MSSRGRWKCLGGFKNKNRRGEIATDAIRTVRGETLLQMFRVPKLNLSIVRLPRLKVLQLEITNLHIS